ncbi:hypothetical protein DEJ49_30350 [Streptomyces venezuelae]|uniref:Uncharacterized protein n=1 Tax=Streptomyces venezuelae TaxID=54571 RepID=A0A5P2CP55_STRVZ|nr:hypothetical protein [Streptomyces venezuelae]QES44722.1 hypothetical protein DEJ49_30350 [Streptomyces venezuelae]
MTGWVRLGGGLGIVVSLCPVPGLTVDAQVGAHVDTYAGALGVVLSERLEICREDHPGAPDDIGTDAGTAVGTDVVPELHARPGLDAPPAPPAKAAPRPARPPAPPTGPPPRTAPRIRELHVPVRLESRPRSAHPAPGPPPRPALSAPGYRPAEEREREGGRSMVTTTMVVTTPAVLAAALLRPRSRSAVSGASGARSRPTPPSGGPS